MKFVSRTLINSNKSKYFTFIVLFVPDSVARFYRGKYKKTNAFYFDVKRFYERTYYYI